jgi:LacI family transcriptional regulator
MTRPRILLAFHWQYMEALHEGAMRYCAEHGWDAVAVTTDNVGRFAPGSFAGVIGPLPGPADHPVRRLVAKSRVPVVELSPEYPENKHWGRCPSDGAAVGKIAGDYLRRLPVASFVFAAGGRDGAHAVREAAFRKALAKDARPCSTFHFPDYEAPSKARFAAFLKKLPGPVGIFGSVDQCALMVLAGAMEAGLTVPGDAYILGFGNREMICDLAPVPLSSIAIDYRAWGYAAAALLDDMMSGRAKPGTVRPFAPDAVVERASTVGASERELLCARAEVLMRATLSDPPSVAQFAKKLGVSKIRLDRVFATVHREGVARYHLRMRLAEARLLLESGDKATAVAAAIGFASYRAFGEAFKKSEGMGPGEFSSRRPR